MQMTCKKCGAPVNDTMKFCRKCGAPLENMTQEQRGENIQQTQNQSGMQGQPNMYGQPNMQGQPNMYGQPNMQGQSNMYGQSGMQGQPNMYGQSGMQGQPNMYGQSGMQGQSNMYGQSGMQGQPNMYGQSGMQGQSNMYGQPNMYGQSDMGYGAVQPKKKKGSGIVFGIGAAIAVVAVLGVGAFCAIRFLPGMFKDPKTMFAENVVEVTRNFSDGFTDFGSKPVEIMLHLGMDDTKDSHTTTKVTTVESDAVGGEDQSYNLTQSYSYDSENGDTSYILSVSMADTSLGTGGIYYNGNEFIYSPLNTTSPMVRYELGDDSAKSLGAYQAMDRYTLMLTGMSSENEVDWEKQVNDFLEGPLLDIDKKEFEKSKEDYTVFGKTQQCDTVSVTVSGQKATDLLEGMKNIIVVGMSNGMDIDTEDIFGEKGENGKTDDNIEVTVKTFSYKNEPVGVVISSSNGTDSYSINLSGYNTGKEKQTILDIPSDKGKGFYYEDGVYSTGSGYDVLTKINFGESSLTINESGTINGDDRNLSGSFTIHKGKKDTGKIHLEEDDFTGSVSQEIADGKGTFITETQTKEGHVKITTTYNREKLRSDKISAPMFLSESGIDCGRDLDMLKENIHAKTLSDLGKIDSSLADTGNRNSLIRLAYVLSLILRNR